MFSVLDRSAQRENLAANQFDLLVIGGGITGAGIALDATLRGLKVALVEKQDFAAGTSSRSTKLIHGGLRYLKQFEFALVREVGRERDIVYRNAPHLVVPERMLLPLTAGGSLGRWGASIGLYIYDLLAGVKRSERRGMLTRELTMLREPLLRKDGLQGGAIYWEYRTDDARLVISAIRKAVTKGAVVMPYTQVDGLVYESNKVSGAKATDLIESESFEIKAKKVINAAGPWVDEVRLMDKSLAGKHLHLTKGVHIVLKHERLPLRQAMYFDVPDGRMIFAIPRDGATYVGTTDTDHMGNANRPHCAIADAEYLLNACNKVFDVPQLSMADVLSSWSGLRPLIHQEGRSPSELSRKDEIFVSTSGLISMAGGKLTGYRRMAIKAVDLVMQQLATQSGGAFISSSTQTEKLAGGDYDTPEDFRSAGRALADAYAESFRAEAVLRTAHRYGTDASGIMAQAAEYHAMGRSAATLLAEADFGVSNEYVTSLSDLLIRRTGMLYFDRPAALRHAKTINRHLAEKLGWDSTTEAKSLAEFLVEAEAVLPR